MRHDLVPGAVRLRAATTARKEQTRLYAPDATSLDWPPGRIAPSDPQLRFMLQASGLPTARLYI
jgi:hypothetical protein